MKFNDLACYKTVDPDIEAAFCFYIGLLVACGIPLLGMSYVGHIAILSFQDGLAVLGGVIYTSIFLYFMYILLFVEEKPPPQQDLA